MAKYLDLDGLTRYDGKIKQVISDGDQAVSGDVSALTTRVGANETAIGILQGKVNTIETTYANTAITNAEIDALFA